VPNADQTSRRSAMILPVERKWSPLGDPLQGCWQAPRASSSPGLEGVEPRMRSEALLGILCAVSTALRQTFTALLLRPPLGLHPAHLEVQNMGNRLLLAIDQHAPGQAAVDFTVDLASMSRSDVYVFHVREVPSSLGVPHSNQQNRLKCSWRRRCDACSRLGSRLRVKPARSIRPESLYSSWRKHSSESATPSSWDRFAFEVSSR
jgi:hypothetical protein